MLRKPNMLAIIILSLTIFAGIGARLGVPCLGQRTKITGYCEGDPNTCLGYGGEGDIDLTACNDEWWASVVIEMTLTSRNSVV